MWGTVSCLLSSRRTTPSPQYPPKPSTLCRPSWSKLKTCSESSHSKPLKTLEWVRKTCFICSTAAGKQRAGRGRVLGRWELFTWRAAAFRGRLSRSPDLDKILIGALKMSKEHSFSFIRPRCFRLNYTSWGFLKRCHFMGMQKKNAQTINKRKCETPTFTWENSSSTLRSINEFKSSTE